MGKRVAVVGGGIIGSAISLHLLEAGCEVVLIDRSTQEGASLRSFAAVSALGKEPGEYYLLNSLGMSAWGGFVRRLGCEEHLHRTGAVLWADEPGRAAALSDLLDAARRRGYPVRSLTERELRHRLPGLVARTVLTALVADDDGYVDPAPVLDACRSAITAGGGRVIDARARVVVEDRGPVVLLKDEMIAPDEVVIAAGAESVSVARTFGLDLALVPSPGFLVETTPVEAPPSSGVLHLPGPGGMPVHVRPTSGGGLLIGERGQEAVARDVSERHGRALIAAVATHFPSLAETEPQRIAVGWRPMPADGLPIVGRVRGAGRVYVAVTHSGITLAPALGRLVAEEVALDRPARRLEAFRPDRFSVRHRQLVTQIEEIFAALDM